MHLPPFLSAWQAHLHSSSVAPFELSLLSHWCPEQEEPWKLQFRAISCANSAVTSLAPLSTSTSVLNIHPLLSFVHSCLFLNILSLQFFLYLHAFLFSLHLFLQPPSFYSCLSSSYHAVASVASVLVSCEEVGNRIMLMHLIIPFQS